MLRELESKPFDTISRDMRKAVADGTIIDEKSADWLLRVLDDPEVCAANVLGVTKFRYWNGNRLDRQRDQLVELERAKAAKASPNLSDYLELRRQAAASRVAAPPASAPGPVVPSAPTEMAESDATDEGSPS